MLTKSLNMKLLTTLLLGFVLCLGASLSLADVAGEARPKSHCELHRDGIQLTSSAGAPLVGAFVPQCDANGEYTPRQCHGSTGHCWCVDTRGQERPDTRSPPGATSIQCEKTDPPKSHCERHRDGVQTTSPDGLPILGVFVPQCDDNGHYIPKQCHGSTGHCWCVDSQGQERPGTRNPPGAPAIDCASTGS